MRLLELGELSESISCFPFSKSGNYGGSKTFRSVRGSVHSISKSDRKERNGKGGVMVMRVYFFYSRTTAVQHSEREGTSTSSHVHVLYLMCCPLDLLITFDYCGASVVFVKASVV